MRNFTIYFVVLLCFFASKMLGQETFEKRAKIIASKIETITKEEKAALKIEIGAINDQLINGTITREEAERKKIVLAEARAINIESRVALEKKALQNLVQEKVDGKIKEQDSIQTYSFSFHRKNGNQDFKDTIQGEKRTTSQFVFAAGLNNVVTNKSVEKSDFRYLGSHFYEWGLTYNSRILKNSNLLHAKYGLSVMYNNLRVTDNRYFIVNGNQTNLEVNPIHQDDSRFKNINLVFPIHIEFDFTKSKERDGKTYFKTHDSFRLGLGGYVGTNLKSKQHINYDIDEYKSREITKGNFNTSDFIYGLSTYIGYKSTSLYLKYDLNPLFKDNAVKQNNVSLGLRFDFN